MSLKKYQWWNTSRCRKTSLSRSFSRSPSNELMDEDIKHITTEQHQHGDELKSNTHSISPVMSNGSSATPNPMPKQESQFESMQQHPQLAIAELKSQYPSNSAVGSTLGSTVNLAATTIEDYIVTPFHLIENLNLIGEEPSIYELIKPLSSPTVIEHYGVLVDF